MNNDVFQGFSGGQLDYMKMPQGVAGYRMPSIEEDAARYAEAKAVLDALTAEVARYRVGDETRPVSIAHLDADNARILDQILGEGEVAAMLGDADDTGIQESVMAGIWRVRSTRADYIEVADIPAVLRRAAQEAKPGLTIPDSLPEGAMNVLPVLAEIRDHMVKADAEHEINLTLLPMTPVDLQVLDEVLGQGRITILSRGYGNCRIQSTASKNIWHMHFFNADDKMILDVIEVGDIPAAAKAAQSDINDSLGRLKEIMEAYFV